jgi:hypothetical protein
MPLAAPLRIAHRRRAPVHRISVGERGVPEAVSPPMIMFPGRSCVSSTCIAANVRALDGE